MGPLSPTDRSLSKYIRPFGAPVPGLIFGGIVGVLLVDQIFSVVIFSSVLIGASLLLVLGVLLLLYSGIPDLVGVFVLGVGLFLVLGSFVQYNQSLRRTWINNQRSHLQGTFRPPHSFQVRSINGEDRTLRLYLLNPPSFLQGKYTRNEVQFLEFSGRTEWFDLDREFRSFLDHRGYHAAVRNLELHRAEDGARSFGRIPRWKNRILQWFSKQETVVPYSASLLQALTTGDRNFPTHLELLLKRLGMVHLFVISGFHVGLLFWFLCKITPGIPSSWRQFVIGAVLILYLSFLGWPLSATRAGIMIGLGALAVQFNRRTGLLDVLFFTVLLFMLWNPYVVFDAGFQLTVGAVLGIQLISQPMQSKEVFSGGGYFWMNVGAFVGTLPVILYHFQYVAPLALPGSILAGALFPFFLGTLVLQSVFLLYEWSVPAQWIEWSIGGIVEMGIRIIRDTGWVLEMPDVPVWVTIVLSIMLYLAVASFLSRTIRLGAIALAFVLLFWFGYQAGSPFLEIQQVREANFVLLRTGERLDILILPPRERLNEFQVDGIGRILRQRGMHHLSYFVGPYNRRLFSQFDPGFTVGKYVPYWESNQRIEWEGGYFDVDELQLQSRFVNVSFAGHETSRSFSRRPALIATSTDGRCLIGNSSQLTKETFTTLREDGCRLTFLREESVLYPTGEQETRTDGIESWFRVP